MAADLKAEAVGGENDGGEPETKQNCMTVKSKLFYDISCGATIKKLFHDISCGATTIGLL